MINTFIMYLDIKKLKRVMGKEKSSKRITRKYPTKEEVEQYEKARRELLEILKVRIPSVIEYEEYFEKHKLNEIILSVLGWVGICENCFKLLNPEGKDLNKLDTKKCEKTKSNQKCYILGKRCRDIQLKGRRCRNLDEELSKWEHDPINIRWHFLRDYLFYIDIREAKKYCSVKCQKQAQNRRYYPASILKGSS